MKPPPKPEQQRRGTGTLNHQETLPFPTTLSISTVRQTGAISTDFGLAKARATAEGQGQTPKAKHDILVSFGGMTPAYCSPEQANKDKLSRATDIWSWAVSVLEMFTGEVTWSSGTVAAEALETYLESESADESIAKMPETMSHMLRRCLKHNPDDRPKDMAEIAEDLRHTFTTAGGEEYLRKEPKAGESPVARGSKMVDLRPMEEREIARSAQLNHSLGPELELFVDELIGIGQGPGFLSCEPGGGFDENCRHIRSRKIAERLNEIGGMETMQAAYYRVAVIVGPGPARALESAWGYIGAWLP